MSFVFEVENKTFWSPSLHVGRILLAQVGELEAILGTNSGIREVMSDTVDVDITQLKSFVDCAIRSQALTHFSLRMLLKGVLQHLVAFLIVHDAAPTQAACLDLVPDAKLLAEKFSKV